jgi:hypothetical protein
MGFPSEKGIVFTKVSNRDYWISNIATTAVLTIQHISEFHELWVMLQSVHLSEVELDGIICNLTASGEYSAALTNHAQFEGLISTVFKTAV